LPVRVNAKQGREAEVEQVGAIASKPPGQ